MKRTCFGIVVSAFVLLALSAAGRVDAAPIELIVNGGFETGDFTGWTVTHAEPANITGSVYVSSALVTPVSNHATVGPASGTYYAVSDQNGHGVRLITQTFTVPGPLSVMLSFDMFVNDQDAGPFINPAGLDYTAMPNQHARVDLLTAGASPYDTGAGVLANFYLGIDPRPNPNPYTHYVFDITPFVGGGGTYQLRFAEVDNQLFFNQGVDNVSVLAEVPEPATLLLLGAVLTGAGAYRRRRRRD